VELGGPLWPRSGGGTGELGRLEVGDGVDSQGRVVREMRERRPTRKARTKKGKCIPVKTRPTRGLGGPAGAVSACGGSEASGLAGPEAGWAARLAGPKLRKKEFLN
jgi:hypothetical protein